MSKYIRTKYADRTGCVRCITCGAVKLIQEMHAAHFVERGKEATRYIEENVHPACPSCNQFHKEFHMRNYVLWMIDTYGREKVDELIAFSRRICRRRVQDYLEIEAYYKEQLDVLEST